MIEPLHVATVNGRPLRFFRSPLSDGLPDLPWHAVDDLHCCLGLDRHTRRVFLAKLRSAWGEPLETVATAGGIVTIAPHFIAQGVIDATVEQGMAPAGVRHEYDRAGAEAMDKLARPAFGSDAWLAWMKAAVNRWEQHA
jgi:hypothetical protein